LQNQHHQYFDALRQLSNHPKMIDKKSELDSGKYIAVTRYLETLVQSNQNDVFSVRLCLTWNL
jgi:hypothetical protein